jgi:flagellum-specific ATP synthase
MNVDAISEVIANLNETIQWGHVLECVGLVVEAECPDAFVGELCEIKPLKNVAGKGITAEVIGFRSGRVLLMPYDGTKGIRQGDLVKTIRVAAQMKVGFSLLGRVIDAFGNPIDGKGKISNLTDVSLHKETINPLTRKSIDEVFETGIKAIDAFTTIGKGQRLGLMAGSGVGKSSLISSLCRHLDADINVIALIGERGREVEEFVNQTLGEEGLKKSIVIAATAQESPLVRVHAAYGAIAVAEFFASQGKDVFFAMDSVTRFATALREIGLAAGEPPTVKGYTPSVFSAIPDIIERCGNFQLNGAITAIFTVLVESDDFNDPVVDSVRAILDGHIVLSRELAEQSHYPAIDIAKSISRLHSQLNNKERISAAHKLRKIFSDYQQNREVLELGLFDSGNSNQRQSLIRQWKLLEGFLQQELSQKYSINDTFTELMDLGSAK